MLRWGRSSVPNSHLPRRHQRRLRVLLAVSYAAALAGGLTMWLVPPQTITDPFGRPLTFVAATLLILGAVPSLWAIWRDNWRIERWSTLLILGGALSYALAVLALVVMATPARISQACLLAALIALVGYRAVEVDGTARNRRDTMEETFG